MTASAMSFIDRLKARMSPGVLDGGMGTGLLTAGEPPPKSRHVIKANRFDERTFKTARKTDTVDTLVEDLVIGDEHKGGTREGFENAPELVEALFHTFNKAAPQLEHKRRLDRDLYPVRKIVEEMLDNPKLKELQDITASDPLMSTVALDAMSEQLKEIIGRIPPPPPPPQPGGGQQGQGGGQGQQGQGGGQGQGDPNQGGGQGQGQGGGQGQGQGQDDGDEGDDGQGQGQGQGDKQSNDDVDPGKDEDANNNEDEELTDDETESDFDPNSEEAMEQAEADWEAEYDKALDDIDIDRLANKALEAAEAEASELDNLRKGIGLEDGEWFSMNPEERLKFAERLRTPEMKMLAEIVGQMKRFALGVKATRVNDVPHEAYDVEAGNDMRRVLRHQLALLATPETSYEFFRRYTDKELLVYKMRGTEEVGKGPIVMCIDKSYSMAGRPFMWSMGVAEALRRFADEEDRDYYAIFFGTNDDRERFDFPEGHGPFEKVMSFLGTQANGGTQFDGVLTEALEKASKSFDKDGKGKADIVFVTDGMASLTEDWIKKFNAERERVGVRVYSVYIGGARDMNAKTGPVGLLNQVSDAVIPVSELKPESVKQIFQKV